MGFYGNITNTSRTSFSFDKIYSNRYDMDTSCGSDGIYAGRYVLVEYDSELTKDTYPQYYYYDGKMYGSVEFKQFTGQQKFITAPQILTLFEAEAGKVVSVPVGCKVTNLNKSSRYIRITSLDGTYAGITKTEYEDFLQNTFKDVTDQISERDFNGELLYTYDREKAAYVNVGKYTICSELTGREYAGLVGMSVVPDKGLWVYIEKDIYDNELNRFAPLGLGGTVDDLGEQTWSDWWKEHFGTNSFDFGYFENYYKVSQYNSEVKYFQQYGTIFHEMPVLTKADFEPGIYWCYDGNDPTKTFIQAEVFNEGWTYYEPGVDNNIYISNDLVGFDREIIDYEVGTCLRVPIGHMYTTNDTYVEYWMYTGSNWKELTFTTDSVYYANSKGDTNYLTNFAIDVAAYGTSRGFDSTVWQKVYSEGSEKYVMVAELNSVVPTFDLSADAPTLIPITPHFDNDSTNVYYKLHQQAAWGIRTKAASDVHQGIQILQDGTATGFPSVYLTDDHVIYPSDAKTKWRGDFYNPTTDVKKTNYYNVTSGYWDTVKDYENSDIPAAIYFNLDGFNPDSVAYSQDILDETQERFNQEIANSGWINSNIIGLFPTGKSGHLYNQHGHTVDQAPEVDTQEFSVMLPAIGDSLAQMWDMVYGGRETNQQIAITNERNMDTAWENARATLDRHGLRLVNDDTYRNNFDTDAFATAEVNTLAGAINSAHDIIGMIITAGSHATLMDRIDTLDADRIYYDQDKNKYYRKHKTYDYTEIPAEETNDKFTYTQVDYNIAAEEFCPEKYFIIVDGKYVALEPDAKYDPAQTYYIRTGEIYEDAGEISAFDPTLYYYMDYTGSKWDEDPISHIELMDFIKHETYLPGHNYYTIDEAGITLKKLSDGYRANKYYYIDSATNIYTLDSNKNAIPGTTYYDINNKRVTDISLHGFGGIYVPGVYYFTPDGGNTFQLDMSNKVTAGRSYFLPRITATVVDPDGTEKTFIKRETYVVADAPLNADQFYANEYYYKNNPNVNQYAYYNLSWDEYEANPVTLYYKTIEYVPPTEDTVMIDIENEYILTGFAESTFFYQKKDIEGKIISYEPVTVDKIKEELQQYFNDLQEGKEVSLRPASDYKAFICGLEHKTLVLMPNADGTMSAVQWWDDLCPFSIKQAYAEYVKGREEYACHPLSDLYFPDTYHYKDKNGSYILDTYGKMTHDTYYLIDPSAITYVNKTFYEPYKYYSYNTEYGKYDKLTDTNLTEEELTMILPLYERKQLYVLEDKYGVYEKGAVWNPHALKEPDTVTLATREERWELKEIESFARKANTMHGLLLKINEFLEYDDTYTRDERIANGLLNQLRDAIAKFDTFIPRNFMTIDDYGRLHSTDWDTRQGETSTLLKTYPLMKDVKGDVFEEVEKLEDMRKQWITLHLDGDIQNPTLTVHHNFQHVTDTTSDFDMNAVSMEERKWITETIETPRVDEEGNPVVDEEGNQIIDTETKTYLDPEEINQNTNKPSYTTDDTANLLDFYTPIVDEMGHVVGHNIHTVTLPFNFKGFYIANQSDKVEDMLPNIESIIANKTQDNLTFASGNKWIKFAADPTEHILSVAHEVHPFIAGEPNTAYGLLTNQVLVGTVVGEGEEAPIEEVLDNDNTFEVPMFEFDEAGHITRAETHTVTLPENFSTITVENSDDILEDSELGTTGVIEADSLIDNLTLVEGNRWINLEPDVENDKIIFKHYVKKFEETSTTYDFNEGLEVIDIQALKWDAAGHILESVKTSYTLPYNVKTLKISSAGELDATVNVPRLDGDMVAKNPIDAFQIATGNRWLTFSVQNNEWKLYHAAAGVATLERTKGVHSAQTPNFGGTFTVPTVGIDEAGHVAVLTENEVKIPLPSIVDGTDGNVITSIGLIPSTGEFTINKSLIGFLKLNGYELKNDYSLVSNTDTLNQAISKLQLQIKNVTTFLSDLENTENASSLSVTIEPNYTCQVKNITTQLNLNFEDTDVNYYAEYRVIFTTGSEGGVVSIPSTYTWDGDEPPTLQPNKKYIIMTDNISHIVTISKGVSVK